MAVKMLSQIQMADVTMFTLLRLVYGFQAILLTLSVRAQQPCLISTDQRTAQCQGLRLERVPTEQLPPSLEQVDLSYNFLRVIQNMDFVGLPLLRVLLLRFNNISVIDDDAFKENPLLENLNIFNNSLTAIPSKALSPLSRLKSLDMSNNLYTVTTLDDVFLNFRDLKVLSIGGTLVSILKMGDLDALQNLSLERFAIKTGSSLVVYEPGYLKNITTRNMWFDVAIDSTAHALPMILKDLANKTFQVLRFRNLFEFKYYSGQKDIFYGLQYIKSQQLVFYRGKFNEELLRMALVNLQQSPIKVLQLLFIDFARSPTFVKSEQGSSVTNLELDIMLLSDISNPDILRFDWSFTWFNKIHHLCINNVNFNSVPCDAWQEMTGVRILDISNNQLKDSYLLNQQCDYHKALPSLHTFNLSNNQLTSLSSLASLTAEFKQLQTIDISHNKLGTEGNRICYWKQNITKLIANHNNMVFNSFKCLPTTVLYLDLSYCNLDQLDMDYFMKAINLKELYLNDNKIKFIPSGWKSYNLKSLSLDGNSFGIISMTYFKGMPSLEQLRAGNNPYHCTCELHAFIQETTVQGKVGITDWPENYKCYHPENLLNTMISNYFPGHVACDVRLIVVISAVTTAAIVLVMTLMCYFLNVPWYAKAMYQIIRAKYRAHKEGGRLIVDYSFHAFISYSHSDAEWVRDQLLLYLESCRPPYRICIHERDFMPGKWIIDNIIQNIENSRKVIFVLSQHFVNSEWCNYELYFAQQRAIGKTFSDVILVVKEPIDPDTLPSKYCKLKKMLSTKTYLEWPQHPKQQAFFWAQLKSVLGKPNAIQELSCTRQSRFSRGSSVSMDEVHQDNQRPTGADLVVEQGAKVIPPVVVEV